MSVNQRFKIVMLAMASSLATSLMLPTPLVPHHRGVTKMWAKTKVSDWAKSVAEGGFVVDGKYMTAEDITAAEDSARKSNEPKTRQKSPMELFVKPGPLGTDSGDCPFAHSVRMVLALKGVSYTLTPCVPESKPDWLVTGYDGKMPCLLHDGEVHTESLIIARYLNFFFPDPKLGPCSDAIDAACAPLFPSLESFLKNTDAGADEALQATLVDALGTLDAHLDSSGGLFLGGSPSLGIGDCSLAPTLWHLQIAASHFKGFEVPSQFTSLKTYTERVLKEDSFEQTACSKETVIWGWGKARGE
mmetsp:Transcript_56528/g.113218  ORF Transcript_56528/g.113218 Transcript_56528/m.113218 type:complete len:302 (+) Transcript_56528:19-924(+)